MNSNKKKKLPIFKNGANKIQEVGRTLGETHHSIMRNKYMLHAWMQGPT